MRTDRCYAAADLGGSNGRVMVGRWEGHRLRLTEAARFANQALPVRGTLHWNTLGIVAGIVDGLAAAARTHPVASLGIDTWGVDYGRLDASGALLGQPVSYRDARTGPWVERLRERIADEELYAATGIQPAAFNTIYQLLAEAEGPSWDATARVLLTPDLMMYLLGAEPGTEATIASTTGLWNVDTRDWHAELAGVCGLDLGLFAPLREPGARIGSLSAEFAEATGLEASFSLIAVGSHDTASAVAAVPAEEDEVCYLSSGTWSMIGLELDSPVVTPEALRAGFTNEAGIDHTVLFMRNLSGLWPLQECQRQWRAQGQQHELQSLLAAAADVPVLRSVVDAGSEEFLSPGEMPERIRRACAATGQPVPGSEAEIVRCILDSLALAYRESFRQAQELAGRECARIHLVGGGSQNTLLAQLTADACGVEVVAGPVEAAAYGNVLVQARTLGDVAGGLTELREVVRRSVEPRRYRPRGDQGMWEKAAAR